MTTLDTTIDRTASTRRQSRYRQLVADVVRQLAGGVYWLYRAGRYIKRNHRYLTMLKLANMAAVNLQFAGKRERVIGRPYKMKIESTNICNTKCQLCPTGIGLSGRDKGKMSYDRFTQLIDKVRWHLLALDLSMWGDPLIVPDIYRMIRYAHDANIWTYISSNLHAYKLEPKAGQKPQAQQLVESGLDVLTCSLHGASQCTYEQYQPGKKLDDALAKIRQIIETRDRLGSATPHVQLNFVVMKQNEHEIPAFRKLAAELGCDPVFNPPALNARFAGKDKQLTSLGLAPDVEKKRALEMAEKWLPEREDFRLPLYDQYSDGSADQLMGEKYNGHKPFYCDWLWRQMVVNWDGQVSTCCGSFDPGEDMGDVFEQGVGAIYNSRKYRLSRRSFKKPIDQTDASDITCASCPGFMP